MARRSVVVAIGAATLFLLVGAITAAVLYPRADNEPHGDVTASMSLLLETANWGDTLAAADSVSVETSTFKNDLTKNVSVIRWWTTKGSGDGFQLRQDVLTLPDPSIAHKAFRDADPSPGYRKHFGDANPLTVAAAAHADEAVGFCVPDPTGCFIVHYTLRYGTNVIDLSLTQDGLISTSAEKYLRKLDDVVSQRLT